MKKLTPSKNARLIAQQYLKHEFRKIFSDIKSPAILKRLDQSIDNLCRRNGEDSFWNLVAAISEGWKLKSIHYIVSNTQYTWKLEQMPVKNIVLTGMSPTIDKYTIKRCKGSPLKFAQAWHNDKKMRENILGTGLSAHKERDHFPVLLYEDAGGYAVFDGMRRILLSLIGGKNTIRAWVGHKTNSRGKPLISGNRCYFLSNIYTKSKNPNAELEKAIIKICKEIIFQYRNGREVLMKRIAGWSYREDIKKIFLKMNK